MGGGIVTEELVTEDDKGWWASVGIRGREGKLDVGNAAAG